MRGVILEGEEIEGGHSGQVRRLDMGACEADVPPAGTSVYAS